MSRHCDVECGKSEYRTAAITAAVPGDPNFPQGTMKYFKTGYRAFLKLIM